MSHPFGGSGNLGPLPLPDYCEPERSIRMSAAGKLLGPGGVVRPDPLSIEICQEAARHGLRSVWTFRWLGSWTYPELQDVKAILARLAGEGPLKVNGGLQAILVGNEIDQVCATVDDAVPLAQAYLRDLAWFCNEIPAGLDHVDVFGPGIATSDKPGSTHDRICRAILRHILNAGLPARVCGVSLNAYPAELHGPDHPYLTMVRQVTDAGLSVMSAEFGMSCQAGEEHQAWVGMSAVFQALAYGVSPVCWSQFPMDTRFDHANPASIHNHTGMITGSHNAGHCYRAAGEPRIVADLYRYVGDLWRAGEYGTGIVDIVDGPASLLRFDGTERTLYVVILKDDGVSKEPHSFTIAGRDQQIIRHDLTTLTETAGTGPVTIPASVIPQAVEVVGA